MKQRKEKRNNVVSRNSVVFLKDRSKKERQSISAKELAVHDGWMFHKCQTVPNCDIQYTVTPWILSYIVQNISSSTCFAKTLQNTNAPNNKAIIFALKRMCLFFVTLNVELNRHKAPIKKEGTGGTE